jgi:membrane protein
MLFARARGFAFILAIGFLLLVSFSITAAISALSDFIRRTLPDIIVYLAFTLDFVLSVGIITVLFALIFKYLPDARIQWKSVWIGSLITSILFVFGKFLLGLYFGSADPVSIYGAAGTVVLILLWVSYSCLILFFGAEFTWVYAERYGFGVHPGQGMASIDDSDNAPAS